MLVTQVAPILLSYRRDRHNFSPADRRDRYLMTVTQCSMVIVLSSVHCQNARKIHEWKNNSTYCLTFSNGNDYISVMNTLKSL